MKWRLRQWARTPFPLALDDSRSVLAVKGTLRRFAPWTAPGRSGETRCSRGKRGGGPSVAATTTASLGLRACPGGKHHCPCSAVNRTRPASARVSEAELAE